MASRPSELDVEVGFDVMSGRAPSRFGHPFHTLHSSCRPVIGPVHKGELAGRIRE